MSSTKQSNRGFTLVEMLISSVVAALFFGLLYGSFLPVLAVSSASSSKVDTLGAATTALYQLEADIRVSTTTGISVGTTPATPQPTLGTGAEATAVAIEVPEKFSGANDFYGQFLYESNTGLSNFESYVVWALVSETAGGACDLADPCDLYRTTWDSGTATHAATLISPTQLSSIIATITTTGRVVARNVTSLQFANQTVSCNGCQGPARPEVDIELASQSIDQNGKVSQTSYQTQVFDRNN
jgi:prepilin-type N-terminal cleavage/methylation domain-containing protein